MRWQSADRGILEIEFIKMLNMRGPKIDPCGTPEVTGVVVDDLPSRTTCWDLEVR